MDTRDKTVDGGCWKVDVVVGRWMWSGYTRDNTVDGGCWKVDVGRWMWLGVRAVGGAWVAKQGSRITYERAELQRCSRHRWSGVRWVGVSIRETGTTR